MKLRARAGAAAAAAVAAVACGALLVGCGLILGITDGTPRDAADGADAGFQDAPDASLRCNPQHAFSTPVAVAALDTGNDEALARLTSDELQVVFERINGNYELYLATRASASQPFDAPALITSLDTPGVEGDPSLSADGQLLYFVTDRDGGAGAFDIWAASRGGSADGGFGSLSPLSGVNQAGNDQYPYALANSLYFTSDRSGTSTIYRADLAGTSASNVVPVTLAADAGAQVVSVVSEDELVMYFAAAGLSDASGDFDIWLVTRTAKSQPWSAPTNVAELNSAASESPSWLSPDLCRLYMNTNRGGNYDIYLASRTP